MDGDDLNPTKTISRVNISPKSKETVCILCVEAISNPEYRRKLFSGSNKSQACVNLEILVGAKLDRGNSVTENICRNCARTNENVVKKILEIRQQFLSSKERLAAHLGTVDSVKRQSKASRDQVVRSKRKALFGESSATVATDEPVPLVTSTEKSTQTLSWPEDSHLSAVHVVIQYPNSPSVVVKLSDNFERMGRQLALGDIVSMSRAFFAIADAKSEVLKLTCKEITSELVGLCSMANPSVLRESSPEDLAKFSWEVVHDELKNRAPVYLQFLESAVSNPSQRRNVVKKKDALVVPMLDAGCQLISVFNEDMNATRKLSYISYFKERGTEEGCFQKIVTRVRLHGI